MRLTFHARHFSIDAFAPIELGRLTVVTGLNGSGKSHLLQAIESGDVLVSDLPRKLTGAPKIRRFTPEYLVPRENPASMSDTARERSDLFSLLRSTQESLVYSFHRELQRVGLHFPTIITAKQLFDSCEDQLEEYCNTYCKNKRERQQAKAAQREFFTTQLPAIIRQDSGLWQFIEFFGESEQRAVLGSDEDELYRLFDRYQSSQDPFNQSLGKVFTQYLWRKRNNMFLRYEGMPDALSDEAFEEKYGPPPWAVVDQVLAAAGLPYTVSIPKSDDRPYTIELVHSISGAKIGYDGLSSGERVLMSFAHCLFVQQSKHERADFPDLLLLDEVDSGLHPSLTKNLFSILENVFIAHYETSIILTTHSPSTVALAAEESIYEMRRLGPERLQKVSKDRALSILTSGVPTLSISYENRRQVFVESHLDAKYYSRLFEVCRPHLSAEVSINFIPCSHEKSGGCAAVKRIIAGLADAGNKLIFGIIDSDNENRSTSQLLVLGENARHSIENYLIDPLLLGLFLILEKIHFPWREASNGRMSLAQLSSRLSRDDAQSLSDAIVRILLEHAPVGQRATFHYISGVETQVPEELAKIRGKDLEELVYRRIPQTKAYRNVHDGGLKAAILNKLASECPNHFPMEFIHLFRRIQSRETEQVDTKAAVVMARPDAPIAKRAAGRRSSPSPRASAARRACRTRPVRCARGRCCSPRSPSSPSG